MTRAPAAASSSCTSAMPPPNLGVPATLFSVAKRRRDLGTSSVVVWRPSASDVRGDAPVDVDAPTAERDRVAGQAERCARSREADARLLATGAADLPLVLLEPSEHVHIRPQAATHDPARQSRTVGP